MAITFSGVNAWVDEHTHALDFYTEALMSNTVVPWVQTTGDLLTGVKANEIKLPNLSATSTMQDGDNCAFNASGSVVFSQSSLLMKNIKFQDSFCVRTMEDYFTAVTLPPGQMYTGLGQAEAAMLDQIRKQIQKNLAYGYFNETSLFSGWLPQIYAAFGLVTSSTTPNNGGANGTDAQGVWNICETLVNLWLASADLSDEIMNGGVSIVMSPLHVKYYFENFRTLFGDNPWATAQLVALDGGSQSFVHSGTGVRIYVQPALTGTGTIIMSRNGNFTLGFDLASDNTGLTMGLDQYQENIWYTLRTKIGVGFHQLTATNLRYWGPAS